MPLANKHFAYTLDLSNVPCHCNAAAYFVDMPAAVAGRGDYYCAANYAELCPEYDVMEGNKHTIACTLHTCNGGGGNWDYCDGGGCQVPLRSSCNRALSNTLSRSTPSTTTAT